MNPRDVTKILTDGQLAKLREAYAGFNVPDKKIANGYAFMRAKTSGTVTTYYPAAGDWVGKVIASQYDDNPLAPKDRERTLIALLASKADGPFMAIHVYWGMMEGLSPTEVAHTLFLTACYCGMDTLMHGLLALEKAFDAMAAVAGTDKAGPDAVFGALLVAFGIADAPKPGPDEVGSVKAG